MIIIPIMMCRNKQLVYSNTDGKKIQHPRHGINSLTYVSQKFYSLVQEILLSRSSLVSCVDHESVELVRSLIDARDGER